MSIVGLLGFAAVVLIAMAVLHGYLWFRLVRSTTGPGRPRRTLTLVAVGLALLPVAAVFLGGLLPLELAAPLEWSGFVWLGVAFYLFLFLLLLEPVRLVYRLVTWRRSRRRDAGAGTSRTVGTGAPRDDPADAPPDPSRRRLLARGIAVTAGVAAVGTVGAGVAVARSRPRVTRVPVTLPGLSPALDGFRVVTFADTHLSSTYRGQVFSRVIEMVNEQQPDLVAIVGDLVDAPVEELRDDVAPLADLVTRHGVYFVTGNHEYFVDPLPWMRHLPTLGVRVLRNERVAVREGGAVFDLAGVDDRIAARSGVLGHGADLDAALDGRDESRPVVLLAHQPVQVQQASAAGVDLQLSGHTHGGQLWPFDYAVGLDQPVVDGLTRVGRTQLFVTTGAGYWGPPMRIGARPEIAVVELRSAPG